MSAATRMPVLAGTLTTGAIIGLFSTIPSLRQHLLKYLPTLPFGVSSSLILKLLLALSLLLNFKSLPLVWHWRVLRAIFYQIQLTAHPMQEAHLFKPMVTSSYNSLYDCDYNGHKSNSTYFADLDVARAHLVGALFRTSLKRMNAGDYEGLPPRKEGEKARGKESYFIALGGVACVFRKEIKPLEGFEIWTRLLAWDQKWLYIVSHVVKKGCIEPSGYHLQPWKRGKGKKGKMEGEKEQDMTRNIFATSISKYVCKKGRMTIPPELLLTRSRLLPPKPQGNGHLSESTVLVDASDASTGTGTPSNLTSPENMGLAAEAVSARLGASGSGRSDDNSDDRPMTWDEVEAERRRGMEIAKHFDGLTALQDEFGKSDDVLGKYADFLW
ncbi:hypothetical protein MBLNU457_7154t1 [Dothideomycetes sp. NU457]